MYVFITGDRSFAAPYAALVAIELIRAARMGLSVVTSDSPTGVPAIVRELGERGGLNVQVEAKDDAEDWYGFHNDVVGKYAGSALEVVAIHVDPHSSSVVKSLLDTAPDDNLRIVTHADLLV